MFCSVRWLTVWLLFLGGMINYMDRSALSVAAPLIARDLNLSPAKMGIVFSSFFIGYAIFNFVGGVLADKYGPRGVFGASMGVWSFFCAMTATAYNLTSMMAIRILFGVGEGPFSATANKMVYNWFPRREVASAVGVLSAGTPLGGAVAGPIVGYLALAFGWRLSFVIIGIVGILWLLLWLGLTSNTPGEHTRVSEKEARLILEDRRDVIAAGGGEKAGFRHYVKQPSVLATAFAFFGYNYMLFFFLSWFPTYLTDVHHMSIKGMSLTTVIPWVLGFCGLAAGGFISDWIFRATGRAVFSRKIVLSTCLAAAALCVGLAGTVTMLASAVALMSAAIFFLYLTGSVYWAIIQDTVQGKNVGSVGGFVHCLANIAGIIGPAITGFIVQTSGSFYGAFVLAGGIAILGAAGVAIFVSTPGRQSLSLQSQA